MKNGIGSMVHHTIPGVAATRSTPTVVKLDTVADNVKVQVPEDLEARAIKEDQVVVCRRMQQRH